MSAAGSIFTAARLAAVLDCTKRNVLSRLSSVHPHPVIICGQQAKGYILSDLPQDMIATLKELQGRYKFRSVEQLIAEGLPNAWQPVDLKAIHQDELDRAHGLQRAMYRALKMTTGVVGATAVSVGLDDYSQEFGCRISERHWRRLFDMVISRDAGAEMFDDVRLYVSESPRLKAAGPSAPSVLDLQLDIINLTLAAIRKASEPTEDEVLEVWHRAFQQAEIIEQAGCTRVAARGTVLDCIRRRGVSLAKTDKALDKAWKRKYAAWLDGGRTSQALEDARKNNPGREPLEMLTEQERLEVQALVIKTDPNAGKTIITSMALRMFAQTPECREELRAAILKPRSSKHKITTVLKGQARTTPENKMLYRGDKTFTLSGHKQPRALTYIDEEGNEQPILPGDLFESDDMHVNQPFYVPWEDPNDKCADRYGVRAFRAQLLPVLDVGSARFISHGMALRYTDAYRASDILWTFLNIFNAVGVPRWLRFERGVWDSETVRRLDAIARIWTSITPGTKFIENRFNSLQKVMGVNGVTVGRRRGEFEETSKDWTAVREGRMHPEKAGFLNVVQLNEALNKSMLFLNGEPMEGEIYKGVPDEIWVKHFDGRSLRKLTDEESITLQPERREVSIESGHVRCPVAEHQATYYFHATEFAKYGTGYRVTVCFDPANPDAGAYILNRESGARACRDGGRAVRMDDLLCWAEHVARTPQFSLASRVEERDSFDRKRRYTEQCRLLYGTVMPFGQGAPHRAAQVNDGRGHVARTDVRGDDVQRLEVGTQERTQEKLIKQVRSEQRKHGISRHMNIKNPKRVLEGMSQYQKALAQLKSELPTNPEIKQ
jgi:hypothetical protein